MSYRPAPTAVPASRPPKAPHAAQRRQVVPARPQPRWARPGTGLALATLFLAATLAYGVTRGGHWQEVGAALSAAPDRIADAAGFEIHKIVITGRRDVSNEEILAALDFRPGRSLIFLDAASARRRLMTNPLVQDATVRKLYPDKVEITLIERHPFALWQRDGKMSIIAEDGTVIDETTGRFANLPLVVGKGAADHAHEILDALAAVPALKRRVYAAIRVGDRRWNLRLDNGLDIKLPAQDMPVALQRLAGLENSAKLLERDITEVDMRFPDRLTVRLSEAAAKAEEDARKKAKKRGTS